MKRIEATQTIQELLGHSPGAAAIFIKLRMLCVGCPSQAFHTLEDVALIHACGVDDLCSLIREAVQSEENV